MTSMSCVIPAPQITEKETSPFQRPRTPQNVKVISGQPDRITISWDHQDDATGFVVYGARISEIGNGFNQVARVRENLDSVDLLLKNADFDASQSYVFTVRAFKQFEGSSEILYSLDSNKVEGAFAPSRVDLNVALTNDSVKLYYNSPNLYSGLNSSQSTRPLYNAKFTVLYKDLMADTDWVKPSSVASIVNFEEPNLYTSLNINTERFIEGRRYLFKVIMDIEQPDGSFHSIPSKEIELIVSGDMLPTPITTDRITVSQGESLESITVEWTIPEWTYNVSRENSYFKIQRSTNGAIWDDLVDEISTKTHDPRIVGDPAGMECSFIDTNVEVGQKYLYRIVNAAQNKDEISEDKFEQGFYIQDEVPESSLPGYLYEPVLESFTGTWTKTSVDSKPAADLSFEWKLKNNNGFDGLSWELYKVELRAGFDNYIQGSIMQMDVVADQDVYNHVGYQEVYDGSLYSSYYYALVMKHNGNIYKTFDLVADFGESGDLVLGVFKPVPADKPLIDAISVSNDRNEKIVITWTVQRPEGYDPAKYTYHYKFNAEDSEYAEFTSIEHSDDTYTAVIDGITETGEKGIYIKVDAGTSLDIPEVYIPERMFTGNILSIPSDLVINAYKTDAGKVFLEWVGGEFTVTDDLEYSYGVREYKSSAPWTTRPIADINSRKIEVEEGLVSDGKLYEFNILAHNKKDQPSEIVEAENKSLLLPIISDVTASKGESETQVFVRWTDTSADVVYKVYRYGKDKASTLEELSQVDNPIRISGNNREYTDMNPVPEKPYYTVSIVKDGFEGVVQSKFNTVENNIKGTEYENMGYVFGLVELKPVAESYLDETTNHLRNYFTISFKADPAVNAYALTDGMNTHTYSIADFRKMDATGVMYSNGMTPDEIGYATFDTLTGEFRANVRFSNLDNDLSIKGLKVIASNSKVSKTQPVTGIARRDLDKYDYIYIANGKLNDVLGSANNAFNKDWWGGTDVFQSSARKHGDIVKDGFHVTSIAGVGGNTDGTLEFWEYKGSFITSVSIKTDEGRKITLQCVSGGDAGYLGTDPLTEIGHNPDENFLKVYVPEKIYMDNVEIKYESALITYNNISAEGGTSGQYKVQIGNGDTVMVPNDENILMKIKVERANW